MRTVLIAAFLGLVTVTAVAEAQWLNYPDSHVLRSGDGKPILTALAPRAADGKPDRSAASATAQTTAPAELRAVLEGTWELEEWHAEGEIMRPPQMTGRWMVHDGVVMAIRHRDGPLGGGDPRLGDLFAQMGAGAGLRTGFDGCSPRVGHEFRAGAKHEVRKGITTNIAHLPGRCQAEQALR